MTPTVVHALRTTKVLSAAGSYLHTIAVCENGTCYTFGHNDKGQLGVGHCGVVTQPTKISLNNVASAAAGYVQWRSVLAEGCRAANWVVGALCLQVLSQHLLDPGW